MSVKLSEITGNIIFGDVSVVKTILRGDVGIGTDLPSQKLHVVGGIFFNGPLISNGAAGTAGQVLTSAGSGSPPTWATVSGSSLWQISGTDLTQQTPGDVLIRGGDLIVEKEGGTEVDIAARGYGVGPVFHGYFANGTKASPTRATTGQLVYGIGCRPYTGTVFTPHSTSAIHFIARENITDSAQGTAYRVLVTPVGTTEANRKIAYSVESDSTTEGVRFRVKAFGDLNNRFCFQGLAADGPSSSIGVLPAAAGGFGQFNAFNSATPANSAYIAIRCTDVSSDLLAGKAGSGTALPLAIFSDDTERMRITTDGNVGVNTTNPLGRFHVDGDLFGWSFNGHGVAGLRNAIINGRFDSWLSGTSFTASGYGAELWINNRNGTTCTMSRQSFTVGQTAVPGEPQYFLRMAVTTSAGAGNFSTLQHRIEGVRTFAAQTVTLSFWARAAADRNVAVEFTQAFGSVGGGASAPVNSIGVTTLSLTTTWQRFVVTVAIPSISGKTIFEDGTSFLSFNIWLDAGSNFNSRTNSLGQRSGTYEFALMQLEAGPLATPFERRPEPAEKALISRYKRVQSVYVGSSTARTCFPIDMRSVPTISGGGAGFTSDSTADTFIAHQTTAAIETLTLDAQLPL
jgi:hypothetical protein